MTQRTILPTLKQDFFASNDYLCSLRVREAMNWIPLTEVDPSKYRMLSSFYSTLQYDILCKCIPKMVTWFVSNQLEILKSLKIRNMELWTLIHFNNIAITFGEIYSHTKPFLIDGINKISAIIDNRQYRCLRARVGNSIRDCKHGLCLRFHRKCPPLKESFIALSVHVKSFNS